jgi:hypothetical protein
MSLHVSLHLALMSFDVFLKSVIVSRYCCLGILLKRLFLLLLNAYA